MSATKKVVAISDMHGQLPPKLPEADFLVIAGDICPTKGNHVDDQFAWLNGTFFPWLSEQPAKHRILIAGNHDWLFYVPELCKHEVDIDWMTSDSCYYLQDSGVELDGVKIYGTPWQPVFHNWAFNANEWFLEEQWQKIPSDTDILVCHGPPYGYGDLAPRRGQDEEKWPEGEHTGSPSLLKRIREVRPQLVIYGHIHEGHGVYDCDGITLANVSMLDGGYRPIHSPTILSVKSKCKLSACADAVS